MMEKEQKKISKQMIEEMEEFLKEKKEEVKKVTNEMDEDLKKVTKEMHAKLKEIEDTIQEAQEELNMELRDFSGDGVEKITEVDENEKPLEHAMSCLKLEEALKDPNDASAGAKVLNQRPKRVIKPNPRYKGSEWV